MGTPAFCILSYASCFLVLLVLNSTTCFLEISVCKKIDCSPLLFGSTVYYWIILNIVFKFLVFMLQHIAIDSIMQSHLSDCIFDFLFCPISCLNKLNYSQLNIFCVLHLCVTGRGDQHLFWPLWSWRWHPNHDHQRYW